MKKKLDTAADVTLDEATEAAKLTLADRLVKEAPTCDLKTLAEALAVADQLRGSRRRAETDALRQQALGLLGDKLPNLLDVFTTLVASAPPMGAPRPCA